MRQNIDLYLELVKSNFKLRYQGSILGVIWVMIKPLVNFVILYIVFSRSSREGLGLDKKEYAVYLLLGIITFSLFREGITLGMKSLLSRHKLLLKVNFDRFISVISSITMAIIDFFIKFGILLIFIAFAGANTSLKSILYFIFTIITLLLSVFSISMFTSIILIRFRDLENIVQLALRSIYFLSAVILPISVIGPQWQFIVLYNPVAVFVQAVRHTFVYDQISRYKFITFLFCFSIIMSIIGIKFFNKKIKKIAEYF